MYLYDRIADSIGGIFLIIQTLYSIHIRYELSKFVCDWLIINDTLLVQQRTFKAVCRLPWEGSF